MHVIQCAEIGADVVTAPLNVLLALLKHPLTDIGLAQFLADANKGTSK
jgi:transaldolase